MYLPYILYFIKSKQYILFKYIQMNLIDFDA